VTQAADDRPLGESDLEGVTRARAVATESSAAAARAKDSSLAGAPPQLLFGQARRHGLVPDPAEGNAHISNDTVRDCECGADRDQRELVRLAIAELEVERSGRQRRGR